MGKIVVREKTDKEIIRDAMLGKGGPLYDKQTELYPMVGLPKSPVVGSREAEFINYNWALSKTIGYVQDRKLNRSEVFDILLKAERLFRASYQSYYGKVPVLPEIKTVNQ